MAFTYVGQAVKEDNTFNVGEELNIPASTADGDLITMQVMTRGNTLFVAPSGWTTIASVNNNNNTSGSAGRASSIVAYIVRGASLPSLVLTGYGSAISIRAIVKAYRPTVGVATFVGSSTLNESGGTNTAHDHAAIDDLQADDLLVMEMASSNTSSCFYGGADAATDPSTASAAPSGSADGTVTTTGMPTAGSWVNRYAHRFAGGSTFAIWSGDGVASTSGSSGTLTMASSAAANMVGATMAFRDGAGGPTPIAFAGTIPTLNGTVGSAFSEDLSSYFSGSETPFAYTVQTGTLPAGLTLNSSTGVISGTPTTAGTSAGIVIRGTDATPDTADSNSFSIVIAPAAATSMTIALKQADGTTAAASITGIEYAVLNAATVGAASAILDSGTGESTDGSGNLVLDITGLGLVTGDVRYVVAGKSNGTVGADFDGWQGPATAA